MTYYTPKEPYGAMYYLTDRSMSMEARTPHMKAQGTIHFSEQCSERITALISPLKFPVVLEILTDGEKQTKEVRINQIPIDMDNGEQVVETLAIVKKLREIGDIEVRW